MAAIETYPETLFPDRFADAHMSLATSLFRASINIKDVRKEAYMLRAINSYEISSLIFKELSPARWAECQTYVGSIFVEHGKLEFSHDPEADFKESINRFEMACEVYQMLENTEGAEACKRAIAKAKKELAAL